MDLVNTALTSLLSVAALYVMTKLMGHKQMSQLDFFDYVSGITIGSIAAELATELEAPLKPLIALGVYCLVSLTLSALCGKYPRARKYINGTPSILMAEGRLYRKNLKKAKLDLSDFLMMCRMAGYFDLSAIKYAVYEYNGRMSFMPAEGARPATTADLSLTPPDEGLFVELIMDGRILGENLGRMGLSEKWLKDRLREQGYSSPKKIFLGLCDNKKNLTLYPTDIP